jgi:hypothetical protein
MTSLKNVTCVVRATGVTFLEDCEEAGGHRKCQIVVGGAGPRSIRFRWSGLQATAQHAQFLALPSAQRVDSRPESH